MASLLRSSRRSAVLINFLRTQGPCHQSVCHIQTSKKKKDVGTAEGILEKVDPSPVNSFEKPKNAINFGFSLDSEKEASMDYQLTLFCIITVAVVGSAFLVLYLPDKKLKYWSQREAYLDLYKREKEGLPPIDKNYIPEDQMVLPSEEELKKVEIIV
ncbi:NADH dehydrogenase [ubiquinone] 1 beta subcomplex subunit 11, mitochondrial [Lingula anatina]|uniref:NADH dehydrogenase [ubiquinone] 1 beta subcomplex subunit 11, mitochondrial n=1 Tax=Lingula anatina TaxID=7574 RepID=A0A1S3I884_LINAN|nr:NADH dehydrogenase [ubiquinone] 1 beta subcomplex subunit 11, mitochondrial [Lingula anatina]|eukprot:XP_013394408.1 NADH dehydrogenase [ubiquinone] 1 beta subcomplex subunit 11, mitochondrial [Lingula anatina]